MSDNSHNPHDAFFRKALEDISVTRNLLQHELPEQIAAQLDFSTIERVNGSYVNKTMRNIYSDMVFQVRFNNSDKLAYIYTLFEHKSYVDDWCSLQLLKYMVSQWEEFHTNNPREKLPPIIPLVMYHGKRGWRRRAIIDLLNVDEPAPLQPYTPHFDYLLWDVAHMDRARLEFSLEVRAFLEIMHHINRTTLDDALPQIVATLAKIDGSRSSILEKIETYLRYAVTCSEHVQEATIERSLEAANAKEDLMATLAQKWISEGRVEGRAEGMAEGEARGEARGEAKGEAKAQYKLLRKIIQSRFGQVPPEVEQKIANASETEVDLLVENIFKAASAHEAVGL